MKLKKTEKWLLFLLLVVSISAFYYFNVYLSQTTEISELNLQLDTLSEERDSVSQKIMSNLFNKTKLTKYQNTIAAMAPHYYGSLTQSQYVMKIREIAETSGLVIKNLVLDESEKTVHDFIGDTLQSEEKTVEEIVADTQLSNEHLEQTLTIHSANIAYAASYEQLQAFVSGITNKEPRMIISEIDINKSANGLNGSMIIMTHNVPSIEDFVDKNMGPNYFKTALKPLKRADLFAPYPVEAIPEAADVENAFNVTKEPATIIDEAVKVETVKVESADTLIDFKTGDFFFVGNRPEISGQISLQEVPNMSAKATLLDYKFNDLNSTNEANIVFAEKTVMSNDFFPRMRLKWYGEAQTKNVIKVEIIDANAQSYIVDFAAEQTVDEWKYSYAEMPTEMQFPIMVRRLFVEGNDVQQDISGKLYIDNLAAVSVGFNQVDGEVNNEQLN